MHAIIIDDNPGIAFLHELILKESHFADRIDTFDKALPALQFLEDFDQSLKPVVIFLDINLPVMSGWDFLDELKKMKHKGPVFVVMATASINRSDRTKAGLYQSVIEYVEKPLSIEICQKLKLNDNLKYYF